MMNFCIPAFGQKMDVYPMKNHGHVLMWVIQEMSVILLSLGWGIAYSRQVGFVR
jgi:hypothetical protein